MKIFILFIALILSIKVSADQPPDWQDYIVTSENRKWTALISRDHITQDPWTDNWMLSVYEGFKYPFPRPDFVPVWSRAYDHHGYSEGILSDDGEIFVYVEFWYRENYPVVKISKKDCAISKNGSFFNIGEHLEKSISHQLWLNRGGKIEFLSINSKPYIKVQTLAGDRYVSTTCGEQALQPQAG
ncbi:hypothetical protein [Microbulbifer sp. A4B17]|uniref:hypothetical protein n=1 Tax=Microbulbifer sp. A4B17 TaxID=359370 RepID=UPI001300AA99|nr:hypothetical protein [Microbulbifer sp. A4B17]